MKTYEILAKSFINNSVRTEFEVGFEIQSACLCGWGFMLHNRPVEPEFQTCADEQLIPGKGRGLPYLFMEVDQAGEKRGGRVARVSKVDLRRNPSTGTARLA